MKKAYFNLTSERKGFIYLIITALVLLIALLTWKYYFDVYEVNCVVSKNYLWADNQSEAVISCYPINSFGVKIPFRKSNVVFSILEGKELIDVISKDEVKGTLKLKSKFEEGKVVIKVKSGFSLLPNLVEINIMKNLS